jgi:hypothetical protein
MIIITYCTSHWSGRMMIIFTGPERLNLGGVSLNCNMI